jgi:hypothetical protein
MSGSANVVTASTTCPKCSGSPVASGPSPRRYALYVAARSDTRSCTASDTGRMVVSRKAAVASGAGPSSIAVVSFSARTRWAAGSPNRCRSRIRSATVRAASYKADVATRKTPAGPTGRLRRNVQVPNARAFSVAGRPTGRFVHRGPAVHSGEVHLQRGVAELVNAACLSQYLSIEGVFQEIKKLYAV